MVATMESLRIDIQHHSSEAPSKACSVVQLPDNIESSDLSAFLRFLYPRSVTSNTIQSSQP